MKLRYLNNSLPLNHVLIYYGNIAEFKSDDLLPLLSLNEIKRAGKFAYDSDRRQYIITRAMLKRILEVYLQKGIEKIDFHYDTHGKPFLPVHPNLQFNCSHTSHAFAIGITQKYNIGIDIEHKDRLVDISKLKKLLFSENELEQFESIPDVYRQQAFIHCWTKKEALLKATGSGLTRPMNEFSLSGSKKETMRFDTVYPGLKNPKWFVKNFHLPGAIVGALATNGQVKSVNYINVNEVNW